MAVIDDIAQYLDDQNIGTLGSTIYKAYLPDSGDTLIGVFDTGGTQPDPELPTHEPTFQIIVRAPDYSTGAALIESIRAALHKQTNVTLVAGGQYYYFILANAEGGHIGRNDRGLDEFSINFRARTRDAA